MSFERAVSRANAVETTWMAARLMDWAQHDPNWDASIGVGGILFEVGAGRSGWLARLAASDWFRDYSPRAVDLPAGEEPSGRWTLSPGSDEAGLAAALASSRMPQAQWWTAIAMTREAGAGERTAVLELVRALRQRRSPAGDPLCVVVTIDGPSLHEESFVPQLLERGAFVIRPAGDVEGDHLHHFPLRAFVGGARVVCVDLFDILSLWRPGRTATLYQVPMPYEEAYRAMESIPVPLGGAQAIDLRFHFRSDWADVDVEELCGLAERCAARFVRDGGHFLYTNNTRMDGRSGSADLLIVD